MTTSRMKAEDSAEFHQFLRLPQELQTQIWQNALPGNIGRAALFTWRPGCWSPAFRVETDSDWRNPINDEDLNLILRFYHDRLGDTQFYIPMARVSAEALDIARSWAAEQGVEVRDSAGGDGPMFVRPFHPECDVLYVSPRDWDQFVREPLELPFDLDIFKDQFYGQRTQICRVAVSERSLANGSVLWDLEQAHPNVKCLYVVADPQPDDRSSSEDMSVPWRLQLQKARGWELVWVSDNQGVRREESFVRCFQAQGHEGGLQSRVAKAIIELHEGFMQHVPPPPLGRLSSRVFEIRIVHIVKVG